MPSLSIYNMHVLSIYEYWRCTLTLTHYVTDMDLGEDSDSHLELGEDSDSRVDKGRRGAKN